jgi:hypothetical protein
MYNKQELILITLMRLNILVLKIILILSSTLYCFSSFAGFKKSLCSDVDMFFNYQVEYFSAYYQRECKKLDVTIGITKSQDAVKKAFIDSVKPIEYKQAFIDCRRVCDRDIICEKQLFDPVLDAFIKQEQITKDICRLMV